jgi:hypothetical protein
VELSGEGDRDCGAQWAVCMAMHYSGRLSRRCSVALHLCGRRLGVSVATGALHPRFVDSNHRGTGTFGCIFPEGLPGDALACVLHDGSSRDQQGKMVKKKRWDS